MLINCRQTDKLQNETCHFSMSQNFRCSTCLHLMSIYEKIAARTSNQCTCWKFEISQPVRLMMVAIKMPSQSFKQAICSLARSSFDIRLCFSKSQLACREKGQVQELMNNLISSASILDLTPQADPAGSKRLARSVHHLSSHLNTLNNLVGLNLDSWIPLLSIQTTLAQWLLKTQLP